MYVQSNNNARSRNHCCSGIEISITYSKYVSIVLVIKHVTHMSRTVICGLSGSTCFPTLS